MSVSCDTDSASRNSAKRAAAKKQAAKNNPLGDNNSFVDDDFLEVDVTDLGIPKEIKILSPKLPDLKVKHDIPTSIEVKSVPIPDIRIIGPDLPLPTRIDIVSTAIIPERIEIVATDIPVSIALDASDLPASIKLEVPKEFPKIEFDTSNIPKTIQVVGIPETIELKGTIPSEIMLKAPENLEVPLVYKGNPIPVQLDMKALTNPAGENQPCFAIVPCPANT